MGGVVAYTFGSAHCGALLVALSVEVTQSGKRKATVRCFGGPAILVARSPRMCPTLAQKDSAG